MAKRGPPFKLARDRVKKLSVSFSGGARHVRELMELSGMPRSSAVDFAVRLALQLLQEGRAELFRDLSGEAKGLMLTAKKAKA